MSYQFLMTLAGDAQGSDKNAVVGSDTPIEVPTGAIGIMLHDNVDIYRKVEILEGWKWLWHGMLENNILDPLSGFAPGVVYSSCPLDNLTSPARKTTGDDPSIFIAGDIAIGLGNDASKLGGTVMMTSAFEQLRQYAGENGPWV